MDAAAPDAFWYCRRGAELIGPISTARLEQMIADRAVRDHDLVRLGGDGEWMSVGDIHQLFEPADTPADASQAARDALARSARAQLTADATDDAPRLPRPSRLRPLGVIADLCSATIGRAFADLASLLLRVLKYRPVRWGALLAIVAGTAWAIVWFVVLPRMPISATDVLAEYRQLWNDVETAQQGEVSAAEWERLLARAESLAFHHELPLRHHAQSRRPALQELLWATPFLSQAVRDVRDGKADQSQSVSKLVIHLDNAERLIAREIEVAEEQPGLRTAATRTAADTEWDWLLIAFLVFDGLLALGAVAYLLRRVRRRGTEEHRSKGAEGGRAE